MIHMVSRLPDTVLVQPLVYRLEYLPPQKTIGMGSVYVIGLSNIRVDSQGRFMPCVST